MLPPTLTRSRQTLMPLIIYRCLRHGQCFSTTLKRTGFSYVCAHLFHCPCHRAGCYVEHPLCSFPFSLKTSLVKRGNDKAVGTCGRKGVPRTNLYSTCHIVHNIALHSNIEHCKWIKILRRTSFT